MAIYDNLPVFKETYDLLLMILKFSSGIQRDFRFTVGETLKKDLIALCICIYRANSSADKVPLIDEGREKMVSIKLMVRVLHDMRQISTRQFALVSERMESVSKQLASWQKYARDKQERVQEQGSRQARRPVVHEGEHVQLPYLFDE